MIVNAVYFLTICALLGSNASANSALTREVSYGAAKAKDGTVVYLETHTSDFVDGKLKQLKTQYFNDKKEEFAYLKSDFTKSRFIPDYEFLDTRLSRRDEVLLKDGDLLVKIQKSKKN